MHRMIRMYARFRQTDRQTNIMAIARRFILTNASRAKNWCLLIKTTHAAVYMYSLLCVFISEYSNEVDFIPVGEAETGDQSGAVLHWGLGAVGDATASLRVSQLQLMNLGSSQRAAVLFRKSLELSSNVLALSRWVLHSVILQMCHS